MVWGEEVSYSTEDQPTLSCSAVSSTPASAGDGHRASEGWIKDFGNLCAWLAASNRSANRVESEFPLYRRVHLRSNISLAQQGPEISPCKLSSRPKDGTIPTLNLNVLTLAGPGGPLPLHLTETMIYSRKSGGASMHAFLDLINRRFWELLLQSYRTGAKPQHGFNNRASRDLVFRLAEACAGFAPQVDDAQPSSPSLRRDYLLSYCLHAGSGFGGERAFDELLHRTLGRSVSIKERIDSPIPVHEPSRAVLGSTAGRPLLGRNAVLGCRAFLRKQKLVTVYGIDAHEIGEFIPGNDARALRATLNSLNLAMSGRVEPFALRSMVCHRDASGGACLGKTGRRLGWGSVLGRGGPQTSMVTVSARAISQFSKTMEQTSP